MLYTRVVVSTLWIYRSNNNNNALTVDILIDVMGWKFIRDKYLKLIPNFSPLHRSPWSITTLKFTDWGEWEFHLKIAIFVLYDLFYSMLYKYCVVTRLDDSRFCRLFRRLFVVVLSILNFPGNVEKDERFYSTLK